MLDAFDSARTKAAGHDVEALHGVAAETELRKWLASFLPKRFGVCRGYIISQSASETEMTPHYDVVIYDQLASPVLWVDDGAGAPASISSFAIPAEHVYAVLEVKAALTREHALNATKHLRELRPLIRRVPSPAAISEKYRLEEVHRGLLPAEFRCLSVFFELRKVDEFSAAAFDALVPDADLRGYVGALVLRGEGRGDDASARILIQAGSDPLTSSIGRKPGGSLLMLAQTDHSASKRDPTPTGPEHASERAAFGWWNEQNFSRFAFDLVDYLHGRWRPEGGLYSRLASKWYVADKT